MAAEAAKWDVQELDSKHDRAGFCCGHESLDLYIKQYASQSQRSGASATFVAVRPGEKVVGGYYSIAAGNVSLQNLTDEQRKGLPKHPVPVAILGRLAVDAKARGQGLGELLLLDAMRRIVHASKDIGMHAIEVDAIDDAAKRFYLKYGFVELADDPRHLYLPLKVVRKLGL